MQTGLKSRNAGLMQCQEHLARTLAARMGAQSIAAKALVELDERRSRGEDVAIFPAQGKWLVGPA